MKKLKRIISALIAVAMFFSMETWQCCAVGFDEDASDDFWDDFFWFYWDDDFSFEEYEQFSESLKPKFTAEATSEGVQLTMDYVEGGSFYRIYRYNEKKGKYVKLADTAYTVYVDTDIRSKTTYQYKIRVYQTDEKTEKRSKASSVVKVKTPLRPVTLQAVVTDKKIKLRWEKDSAADGYEIYCYKAKRTKKDQDGSVSYDFFSGKQTSYHETQNSLKKAEKKGEFKRLARTESNALSVKRDKNYNYYFKIRSYEIKNGKRKYSDFSEVFPASRVDALFNGLKGKSKSVVEVISYRSDAKPWTMTISESDKKIFKKFAEEHFTSDMTDYDRAEYLAQYIHFNVDYVYGDDFAKLSGLSCADAVFNKRSGQCYQYNGALAEFLAYLGYDVKLACGFRGTPDNPKSHYWCEVTIDGTRYVLDTGNKKDGLYNFFVTYKNTGYLVEL